MKTIDLNNWTLFSSRPASDNYYNEDETTMLKVFKLVDESILPNLERELEISKLVSGLGIRTPEVGDIYRTAEGHYCITYEAIKNKKSLSRAISEDFSLAEPYMELMANAGKLIHSTKCTSEIVPDYKEIFVKALKEEKQVSEKRKADILKKLEAFPDAECCLHGDFHPGNFIISDGTVYAIDLVGFTKGHYMYDVGMFYFLACVLPGKAQESIFHMNHKQAGQMWKLFVKYYFEGSEPDLKELCDYAFMNMMTHREMVLIPVMINFSLMGFPPFPRKAF